MASMVRKDGNDEDAESAGAHVSRLKAAVHYTVGKLCDEASGRFNERRAAIIDVDGERPRQQPQQITFSKAVVAVIAETTFRQTQLFATDLAAFAKHANRTTVTADDVKLLVRRNPSLLGHITKLSEKIDQEKKNAAASRKRPAPAASRASNSKTGPASKLDAGAGPSKPRLNFTTDDNSL